MNAFTFKTKQARSLLSLPLPGPAVLAQGKPSIINSSCELPDTDMSLF